MVPTPSSCATRRIDTAVNPSASAMARAAAAIPALFSCRALVIRTVYYKVVDSRTVYDYIRTMYETDILVVGAGPTGLTLAIELARRSIAFRLVDAAKSPFAGSRGKGIQPRTLEVFHD